MVRSARSPRAEARSSFGACPSSRGHPPVPLLAAQLFDFHEGKGVDHGSQDLSGDPRVEPAFRGDVVDARQHLVLPPAVHDAHSLRLLERDDLADERAPLDEKVPETGIEIVESTANI